MEVDKIRCILIERDSEDSVYFSQIDDNYLTVSLRKMNRNNYLFNLDDVVPGQIFDITTTTKPGTMSIVTTILSPEDSHKYYIDPKFYKYMGDCCGGYFPHCVNSSETEQKIKNIISKYVRDERIGKLIKDGED